jgi:hypothetical protein
MRVQRHGVGVDVPRGWDVRVYRRPALADGVSTTHSVMHAANFALPSERGDYGSGAVELMRGGHVFVSLVEFHPDAAKTALFKKRGIPKLTPTSFSPRKLQRTIAGQGGSQFFFNHKGRAFCLFVVLGDYGNRVRLVKLANELVARLDIDDLPPSAR